MPKFRRFPVLAPPPGPGFRSSHNLIYQTPVILSDAAVQVLLPSSLIKASKKMGDPDWAVSVFKTTWIPFGTVMILSVIIALTCNCYYPDLTKLPDVIRVLMF
jgi:hypothetical protein